MRIQHNITAMNSYRNFNTNSSRLSKNLEKLSSGYKINRAGDDAAGLAISEKMRAQITGLEGATKNAKDGISLIQTAEGALTEVHDMLNRMTTLAEQSANGTYQNELDREQLQKEVQALKDEIDRVADSTNFNGLKLLDGSLSDKFSTTTVKDSAISEISTEEYKAKGTSPAFSTTYRTNRPEAETSMTRAEFYVDLTDVTFSGLEQNDEINLKVGDATITAKIGSSAPAVIGDVAGAFVGAGKALDSSTAYNGTNAASATTTENFKLGSGAGAYVKIEGHYYEMSTDTSGGRTRLKFQQADYMSKGEVVTPDYEVEASVTDKTSGASSKTAVFGKNSDGEFQSPNWRVSDTTNGLGVGATHQAEAEINIDFTQLKDGDKLTIGKETYTFAIGKDSANASGTNGTALADGSTLVNLTKLFKESADMDNTELQKRALNQTVDAMASNTAWTIGDSGVSDDVGKLALMSKATVADNTEDIGGNANNGKIYMNTEANIRKQIYSSRPESGASVSFNLDVTKIKAGDTFQIDGKTFEFTDGADASDKNNVAINLNKYGVDGGILASQTGDVMDDIKKAITSTDALFDSTKACKYDVKVDGNKMTLTSKDDTTTASTFENRTAAKLELPTETKNGEGLVLQIGDTADSYNKLTVSIEDMHSEALGIGDLDISTQEGAAAALDKIKASINAVSDTRGNMGALQNRLDHTINNLGVMRENIQSAESVIRDTDVAEEMMTYTKNNILNQSAQAMLAQANQLPQGVLQLLG